MPELCPQFFLLPPTVKKLRGQFRLVPTHPIKLHLSSKLIPCQAAEYGGRQFMRYALCFHSFLIGSLLKLIVWSSFCGRFFPPTRPLKKSVGENF